MTYSPAGSAEYGMQVSRGLIAGQSQVLVRGHQPNQATGAVFIDIWENIINRVLLTSAEQMRITSTLAADDGAPLGTGAQTVLVMGVDNTGAAIQDLITMNGVANVLTPSSFLRVNSMVVTAAGSGGSNAGVITAIADVALTQQSHMNADEGISQDGWYTVPLGKTLFVNQVEFNLAKNAGGAQPVVDFRAIAAQGGRLSGAAFIQLFDKKLDAAVSNEYDLKIWMNPASAAIARTDIIMQATTDQNATEMRIRLYGILIDD